LPGYLQIGQTTASGGETVKGSTGKSAPAVRSVEPVSEDTSTVYFFRMQAMDVSKNRTGEVRIFLNFSNYYL
jgi:hypothetical protein